MVEMASGKKNLELQLSKISDFENPDVRYEQYMTSAEVASTLVHMADMNGDIEGKIVVDLGAGTGMLAIGSALRNAKLVIGVERDENALSIAKKNARLIAPDTELSWVLADVECIPIEIGGDMQNTGVMNPPFGAQRSNKHADRIFLEKMSEIASVSYSMHNQSSVEFIETFVEAKGGFISHSYSSVMILKKSQEFHSQSKKELQMEVHRIVWK